MGYYFYGFRLYRTFQKFLKNQVLCLSQEKNENCTNYRKAFAKDTKSCREQGEQISRGENPWRLSGDSVSHPGCEKRVTWQKFEGLSANTTYLIHFNIKVDSKGRVEGRMGPATFQRILISFWIIKSFLHITKMEIS